MRRTIPRLAVALGLAAAALRAPAHEVDCAKLAALAVPRADGSGLPILDPGGLPSLATSPGPILTMDRYPAVVAFDVQIRNLASEPSVISGVADTLPSDPTRVTGRGRRGGAAGPTAAALAAPRALEGAGAPLAPPARRGRRPPPGPMVNPDAARLDGPAPTAPPRAGCVRAPRGYQDSPRGWRRARW